MRCYFPKATFYIYFGVFLLGYIWIFIVYFLNKYSAPINEDNPLYPESNTGTKYPRRSLAPLNLKPPRLPFRPSYDHHFQNVIFDFAAPIKNEDNGNDVTHCVTRNSDPALTLCLYDPNTDLGFSKEFSNNLKWKPKLTARLLQELASHPTAIFIDIGSFVGYYSILAALAAHRVIAIDPFATNLNLLRQTVQMNSVTDLIFGVQAAIYSETGRQLMMALDDHDYGYRFALASVEMEKKYSTRQFEPVTAMQLDDLLSLIPNQNSSSIKSPFIIKISTCGLECHTLNGGKKFLETMDVPIILLEIKDVKRHLPDEGLDKCWKLTRQILADLQYKPYWLNGKSIQLLDPVNLSLSPQIILIKQ